MVYLGIACTTCTHVHAWRQLQTNKKKSTYTCISRSTITLHALPDMAWQLDGDDEHRPRVASLRLVK